MDLTKVLQTYSWNRPSEGDILKFLQQYNKQQWTMEQLLDKEWWQIFEDDFSRTNLLHTFQYTAGGYFIEGNDHFSIPKTPVEYSGIIFVNPTRQPRIKRIHKDYLRPPEVFSLDIVSVVTL
jgi:hypothetical protein